MNAHSLDQHFAFCSGLENSYPVITDHKGKDLRRDGLELSRHYDRWRQDLQLVADFGLHTLRYGPPYYRCHVGPGRYDWSFAEETFGLLRQLQIEPITDLCHFGIPDWLGASFQNTDWPPLFAEYAQAFARQFPWVRLYTPVNEILIAAEFSALNGWWNERKKDHTSFVTALKNLCRANILAQQAILQVKPGALFVQSESSLYFHPTVPEAIEAADFQNQRRFVSLDLCYGHPVDTRIYEYLSDHGMTRQEYQWFLDNAPPLLPHCIMGSDYYITNEKKIVNRAGESDGSGEVLGYYEITQQYFNRYKLPIFHTETNRKDESDAGRWLWKEWFNILRLRRDGLPILGFTWYSFFDQTDWDVELREDNYRINPMGLYDLERRIRPVGETYRKIIHDWRPALRAQPLHRNLFAAPIWEAAGDRAGRSHAQKSPEHVRREHSPDPKQRKVSREEG
jgi:beta-glucosidase/6-phospho-beta-glucosidase/beta-galactosidase